jgi:hemerythrin-like domain-containing protein
MKAIEIIRQEHRALAAVLHGMQYLVGEIRDRAAPPDFALLGAMIYYIDTFPERFHHPKEDRHLFPALRRRHPAAGAIIDRLEAEHAAGAEAMRALAQAFARYEHGGHDESSPRRRGPGVFPGSSPAAKDTGPSPWRERQFAAFADAVDRFARLEWGHMRTEECELLPLAEQHLLPDDWKDIDAAFTGHADPLLGAGTNDEYRALFRRIVNLAPPPIGVGPDARAA